MSVSLLTRTEEHVMEMERRDFLKLAAGALTYSLATEPAFPQTAKVEVHWLGQATTKLTTLTGKVIVIDPVTKKSTTYPGGEPCGFIVEFENGFKLYHMGDTGLFGDMRLIGEYYKPDLVMIPIGGHFVMDPRDAAYATKEMLRPRFAIPIHYGTFPVLRGTPQEYQAALGQTPTQVFPLSPGDKHTF